MNVFIVDACRTPVGRYRGALSGARPDDLAATVLRELVRRNPDVLPDDVEDVWMGASNQAGEDNRNVARMAGLLAGLVARGTQPATACLWSVFLHAEAGRLLTGSIGALGFLAHEMLPQFPALLSKRSS